jgi:hypothetical protein
MAEPIIVESKFRRKVQLSTGVTVSAGQVIYHDGTSYALADASAAASYGQLIALESGDGDATDFKDEINAAPYAVIQDTDAPYTQDASQYLSETAGAITETAPTTAGALNQVLGIAHSTELIEVSIKPPQEVTVSLPIAALLGTAAYLVQDTGPAAGVTLAAVNDAVVYGWHAPRNSIGVVRAVLGWSANITLDASDTYTVDVSSVAAGEANDLLTDNITAASLAVTVDEVAETVITAGFDAAGVGTPGDWVHVDIDKAAEGTAGDDPVIYGCALTYLAV